MKLGISSQKLFPELAILWETLGHLEFPSPNLIYIYIILFIYTHTFVLGHDGAGKSRSELVAGMLPELLFHLGCKPTAGAGRLCVISLSRRNYRKGPIVHDTSSLLYILLYQTKPVWRVIIEAPNAVAKPSILIHFEGPLDGLTSLVSEFDFYTGRTPLSWVVLSCFIRLYPWLTVLGSLLGHEFDSRTDSELLPCCKAPQPPQSGGFGPPGKGGRKGWH